MISVTTIIVNQHEYEVILVGPLSLALLEGQNSGTCSYIDKKIYISTALSDQERPGIIAHEITHAYLYEYSQKQYDDKSTWTPEDICVFIEHYGRSIIKQAEVVYDLMKRAGGKV